MSKEPAIAASSGNEPSTGADPTPRIQLRKVEELTPHPDNPRKHPRKQIGIIARSIEEFRFTVPILVDQNGKIIAGHARWEAAKLIGLTEVPTIRLDHLGAHKLKAYMVADNKISELSNWDDGKLAILLRDLDLVCSSELEAIGFDAPEIDFRIQSLQGDDIDEADDFKPPSEPPVTRLGDTWTLGNHKIHCGDALDSLSYQALLGEEKASAAFIDPPYNVKIIGHVRGKGQTSHREFVMGSK